MNWATGITTCPERLSTLLPDTIASLAAAGFENPFVRCDHDKLGPHPNWHLTLLELWYRNRFADRYAVFQDDLIALTNLRAYLDAHPVPEDGWGNLTSHHQNEHLALKHNSTGWYLSNQRAVGAVGLVFTQAAVRIILGSPHLLEYATDPANPRRFPKYIDSGIKLPLHAGGFAEYCHYPALIKHTGANSSIRQKTWPDIEQSFPGHDVDAMSLRDATCEQSTT